ncbi:MAG: lipopolysaccharide biosynthesis protein [Acidimicrobiales bacterium]|nr:lipopolysaccharide biosynthesis protein [Acidimicrobiales bacterium]
MLEQTRVEDGRRHYLTLFRSGVGLLAARLVCMAISLIMIPVAVGSMSDESFGLWMTVASVSSVLALFNLGVGNALVSLIAAAGRSADGLRRTISTGFALAAVGGLIAGVLSGIVIVTRDWESTLSLSELSDSDVAAVLGIAVATFALTVPLATVLNIRQGQERHDLVAGLTVLGSVVALGLVLLGASSRTWQLIVVSQFAGSLVAAIVGWMMAKVRPAIPFPRWRDIDRELAPRIVRTGAHYFGLQLAAVVAFSSDNLVAARLFGAAEVGEYAVPARVATACLALLALPAAPLWSAIARSLAEGQLDWVHKTIDRFRLFLPVLGADTFVAFAGVVGPVSRVLSDGTYNPDWNLRLWLAAFVAIGTVGNWIATIFNGLSMTRLQVVHSLLMAAANIMLSIALAQRVGIVGLAAGTVISYVVFIGVPYYLRLGSLHTRFSPSEVTP